MLRRKIRSVRVALGAIAFLWWEELSFRVQVGVSTTILVVAWLLGIPRSDWLFVVLIVGIVLAVEAINTAIEELCDMCTREHDPHIARIKDLGAAASLLAGIAAFVVVGVILLPPLFALL